MELIYKALWTFLGFLFGTTILTIIHKQLLTTTDHTKILNLIFAPVTAARKLLVHTALRIFPDPKDDRNPD